MLFFKRSARPRRSPAAIRARLGVEQLESRCVPRAMGIGAETLVNTATADSQQTGSPGGNAVAISSSGGSIVTWSSNNQDGNGWGVYGQRYAANGNALGSEFRVNTATAGDQQDASVAVDSAGDYAIVWSSYGQDNGGWGIYGQRYNSAGAAQGSEFRINTTTAGDQQYARVGMDASGNFTVIWSSYDQDGGGWGIYGQRYNSAGAALGSEFRINSTTAGDQKYASMAMNSTGSSVVTWSSYGQDGGGWGIYGQRYNSAGAAQGSEFRASTTSAGDQMYSSVAMDPLGNNVITWSSYGQDGGGSGIYAQRYNSAGAAQGSEFLVNTTTAGDQMYSSVAMDSAGNFTITWSSAGQDGSGLGVYLQQFTSTGSRCGVETRVNTTSAGDQTNSFVALTPDGQPLIVWSGNGSGDSSGVFAKLISAL